MSKLLPAKNNYFWTAHTDLKIAIFGNTFQIIYDQTPSSEEAIEKTPKESIHRFGDFVIYSWNTLSSNELPGPEKWHEHE